MNLRLLAVLSVCCIGSQVQAQGRRPPKEDRSYVIDGTVKSMDAKKWQVVILRDNGKETTVTFDKNTDLRMDGKETTFDKIKEKQEIRCVYDLDTKVASHFGMYVEIDRPPYTKKR